MTVVGNGALLPKVEIGEGLVVVTVVVVVVLVGKESLV